MNTSCSIFSDTNISVIRLSRLAILLLGQLTLCSLHILGTWPRLCTSYSWPSSRSTWGEIRTMQSSAEIWSPRFPSLRTILVSLRRIKTNSLFVVQTRLTFLVSCLLHDAFAS
ncbi:uncharacterized protein BKA55DRAFT_737821 [Fusarium redolens]|uniref:Uncharacterized protein n=1 Tax=Fusarium redolens TaxID=48865 RepID=A0A9P9HBJ9_FUSRE|nr:uncharacterized protein BKA55DRAFT_737821 [Fusarium redolens]KAH7254087.1 hypothetical protein BKA55DRAFT_737821 [Fusarium redolens]